MRKVSVVGFILLTAAICACTCSYSHDFDFGFGAGYAKLSLDIKPIGDDLLGVGSGQELKDVIGLKKAGNTYWLTGNVRFYRIKYCTFEAETSYWSKTEKTKPPALNFVDVKTTFRDFSIGGNAIFISQKKKIKPFLGAGVALHFLQLNVKPVQFPEVAEKGKKTKAGLNVLGGLEIPLKNKFSLFIAGRFDIVPNWNQFKIYSGIRYNI